MKPSDKQASHRDWFSGLTIAIALLIILFIGGAVLSIIIGGLPGLREALCSKELLFSLQLSLVTATLSTVLVMLLSLPAAYALTHTRMPCKHLAELLIELTLTLPYILLGLALLILFSTPGGKWLKLHGFPVVFSPAGIVMAHLIVNLPYAIRMIKTAFDTSSMHLEYIARTLGASRFKSFVTILIPMCRTDLVSTFILTWARAMGEFGATLMLVGVTRFKTETLPGSIYLNISTGNNEAAMATAVVMIAISALAMALAHWAGKQKAGHERKVC